MLLPCVLVAHSVRFVPYRSPSQVEPCARCYQDPTTGEQVLAATGELHMEICLKDLEEFARTPIVARCVPITHHYQHRCYCFQFDRLFGSLAHAASSEPVVSYMETVSAVSALECVGKSPNNLNRVVLTAQPLNAELVDKFEKNVVPADEKERANVLREHGWDPSAFLLRSLVFVVVAVLYDSVVRDSLAQPRAGASGRWRTRVCSSTAPSRCRTCGRSRTRS